MKPVNVKSNAYDRNPKFKIGDIVRLSKYKNIFAKGYVPFGLKKFFWLKKLKPLFHWHMLLLIKAKKLLECFSKNNCKKQIKKEFRVEKMIKSW